MFDFLFFKENVPSKGYLAGDLKPVPATIILIAIIMTGGYIDALYQLP